MCREEMCLQSVEGNKIDKKLHYCQAVSLVQPGAFSGEPFSRNIKVAPGTFSNVWLHLASTLFHITSFAIQYLLNCVVYRLGTIIA